MDNRNSGGRFNRNNNNRFVQPPVEVGQEIDVKIETVGEKGDGLCKVNNFVIFVPKTKAGETYRIKVTKVLKKVAFAEVVGEGSAPQESAEESYSEEESSEDSQEEDSQEEDSEDFGEE